MPKLLLIFLLLTLPLQAKIKFTNQCEQEVLKLINNSKETIDIAVYSINNKKITETLIEAKKRGVKIRILTDRQQAYNKHSRVNQIHDNDINIKVNSKYRIMHHKFAIFDNKTAIQGSFNWTYSAATRNAEDCNIFKNRKNLDTLKDHFEYLWKINAKKISECYISNISLNKEERIDCN